MRVIYLLFLYLQQKYLYFIISFINENFSWDSDSEKIEINSITSRSEPSSRIFLIGEQPNPWDLLQPQDKMSRHRGAELRRRYELLGGTSLLSLE